MELQLQGSTSIGVFERLIEILLVQEDETSNEPECGVVTDRWIGEPFLEARNDGFLREIEARDEKSNAETRN